MSAEGITEVFHALPRLMAEHAIEPRGVIHVGAHEGQEVEIYEGLFDHVMLVEPNPAHRVALNRVSAAVNDPMLGGAYTRVGVVEAAVGGDPGRAILKLTEFDQQASLLTPVHHREVGRVEVEVAPLRDLQSDSFNVLVVDAQGAELEVLESGDLDLFDMIVVEVCQIERYVGSPTDRAVRAFMVEHRRCLVGEYPHPLDARTRDLVYTRWRSA